MTRPRIALFAFGGTIAMTPDAGGGAVPSIDAADLLATNPEIGKIADIDPVGLARVGSANLTIPQIADLAGRIARAESQGADGVVATQGTDTLADVAFLLALFLRPRIPVILTGAMRHAGAVAPDGPGNLLAAVRAAATPELGEAGILVAMQDELHAARHVVKRHSCALHAFRSPGSGPAGRICEGRVRLDFRPRPLPFLPPSEGCRWPSVALVPACFDDGGMLLDRLPADLDGAVVEAFGGGHLAEASADKAAALARRMPVVLASRTGEGRVLESSYGYKGAERDLIGRGLIPAGDHEATKARLLLIALLAAGADRAAIRAALAD